MHDRRPARVLAYVRVSSDAQERSGTSLAGQREEIERHCASLSWPAPRFYVETESGGEGLETRVQLRALIDAAAPGDVAVVTRQDRWSRDVAFTLQTVRALTKRGVEFLSLGERFDRSTPAGMFATTSVAAMAEFERMSIKARTVGRRNALRDQGCWSEGVSPFGYRRDPTTRRLVVQPTEAEVVGAIFARCVAGEALAAISDWLRDGNVGRADGGPLKWDRQVIHSILRKRWYLGEIRHTDGTWHPAHPPIIPRDVFDQAQEALAKRRKGGRAPRADSRTASWLLRGLAACGSCGRRMGAAYGPKGWHCSYYVCNGRLRGGECDEPYARVDATDKQAAALVVVRLEEMRAALGQAKAPGAETTDEVRVESLRAAVDACATRRARVVSLAVDGIIDREELKTRLAKVDEEAGRLGSALAAEGQRAKLRDPKVRAAALANVETLRRAWSRLDVAARRAILLRLAERVEMRDGAVSMTWRSTEAMGQATVDGNLFATTDAKSAPVLRKPLKKAGGGS